MNKKTLLPIILFAVLGLLAVLLVSVMQMPILLAGGSDSLERIITVSPLAQWLALVVLLFCGFVCFVLPSLKQKLSLMAKIGGMALAVFVFLLSGHNFRYSGRQHALIDSWFFIPVQRVSIDPTRHIKNARFKHSPFLVTAYGGDNHTEDGKLLTIFLGFPPWNLNKSEVEQVLSDLGFE